jgi:predicted transcriptional regulator
LGQKHRSSEEIDFDILKLLTINPSGIRLSTLICKVGLNDVKGKERLLGLERRKLLKIDEIKQRLSHSKSGRRLLSDNPKEITRRIVRTTRKGNSFFKKKNLAGLTVSAF